MLSIIYFTYNILQFITTTVCATLPVPAGVFIPIFRIGKVNIEFFEIVVSKFRERYLVICYYKSKKCIKES